VKSESFLRTIDRLVEMDFGQETEFYPLMILPVLPYAMRLSEMAYPSGKAPISTGRMGHVHG
jgi:hypothetical protein